MSLNRFGKKTLTGEDDLEVDRINIVGQGIGINNNFGTHGQFLKKSSVDNSLEYGSETSYSATLPIVLNGTNFEFDNSNPTTNKICIQTNLSGQKTLSIGTNLKFQENNNMILVDTINLNNNLIIYDGVSNEVEINKDGISVSSINTNFFIGQNLFPINDIFVNNLTIKNLLSLISSSITLDSGNITLTNGDIIMTNGDINTNDITSDSITSTNVSTFSGGIQQSSLAGGGTFQISNSGVGTFSSAQIGAMTITGNISMSNNDIECKAIGLSGGAGSGLDMNNTILLNPSQITLQSGTGTGINMGNKNIIAIKDLVGTGYSNTDSNIYNIFDLKSRHIKSPQLIVYSDSTFTNSKILIDGGNDEIVGSDSTDIAGIKNIELSSTPAGSTGLNMNGKNIINCNTLTCKSGGGGIDMNSQVLSNVKSIGITNGGIDMNNSTISNVDGIGFKNTGNGIDMNSRAIIEVGGLSMKSGGSGIDMNNTDITEVNSITCSTLNLSGEISNSNIPSTISGNKTFTGNTTFSQPMGDDINMNGFDLTNIGQIITSNAGTITSDGDLTANGNILGDGNTQIKNCLFVDETNSYVPDGCYYGTNTAITTPHFVKYILPKDFMPDDDNSDNRYCLSDLNSGAGRNMGTGTQFYAQFTIPQGFRWIGYRVYITNSSRISYTGSGVSSFHSRPKLRKDWVFGQFEFEDFNTSGFTSPPITYGMTNGTFHYMINKPSAGWFNGWNTNNPSGVWTGMIELYRLSGFSSGYYIQGAEVFFDKEDYTTMKSSWIRNTTMPPGISNLKFRINSKPVSGITFNSGTEYTFLQSELGVVLNQAYNITITNSMGGDVSGYTFYFSSALGCSLSHPSWNGSNLNPITITFTHPQSQFYFQIM